MRPLVIVNPRSGGGRTGTTYKAMHEVIERSLGTIRVAMTADREPLAPKILPDHLSVRVAEEWDQKERETPKPARSASNGRRFS